MTTQLRTVLLAAASLALLPVVAQAKEYYVGEPVVKDNLQLVPHYLTGIKMDPMPKGMTMKADAIHVELDVHATKGETHGFHEDEWIPNLPITYTLEKVGDTKFKKTGKLYPMTATDGPHYASNVEFGGDGKYKVTFHIGQPSSDGFYRHVDKESGVPAWWQPITVDWTFDYPSKAGSE